MMDEMFGDMLDGMDEPEPDEPEPPDPEKSDSSDP